MIVFLYSSHLYVKVYLAYMLGTQFVEQFVLFLCTSVEDPDSPSGPSSPKVALLPPILKKVPSDKDRDGQSSPQPSPRTFSQEVSRRSWGPQAQEFQEQKQRSSGKDGHQGSKSSDSGEEAEKEFIFV